MTIAQTPTHVDVTTISPVTDPKWAELIASRPTTVFHSPRWMKVLEETYGLSISASILERDGRVKAGLAWCQVSDFLGTRVVSLPFTDFCDPIATTPEEAKTLAGIIAGKGYPWLLRSRARNLPEVPFHVAATSHFKSATIDVTPIEAELRARVSSMAQRGVRKAERDGVQIVTATTEAELREWYLLHLRLRREKHHLLAQPYSFFQQIWRSFIEQNEGFLLLSKLGDKIIGGTLFLLWQDGCYYKFNASDSAHLALRPNNLVMWRGMLEAKARGCRFLDLGRSKAQQEGLLAFKRSFGAVEEDMYALTYQPFPGDDSGGREAKALLSELTHLLVQSDVPEAVTEKAGSLLYRYFI
jgi:CelD/BcsL family acetyltransferase involved in cellulose biosynthesis